MFGSDLSCGGGAPGGAGSLRATTALVAHGQRLVDTPRPEGGYPLAWHVKAMLVGDLPALAVAVARGTRPGTGPAAVSDR